ncbi:very short patch repair endonuclease [Brevundimonas sp. NIBR10]|uniref:very short patch repair endonuclease n=1 Tax=Brevundimonas sp. NIBR10 TaxID=3015997 RepID=UPI0022F18908|nr:very short patch repair endonuclease [Brevundimonas sp. NIBR10]
MPDIVDTATRSRMMSGIRGKNTKPEMLLRQGLHKRGLRYRLHEKTLPGKPDLVFARMQAVLFAHGCFWHGHNCHLFRMPSTRPEFWAAKIERNREVDQRSTAALLDGGWRVGVVWECALKGRTRLPLDAVLDECQAWLAGSDAYFAVGGMPQAAS